MKIYRITWGHDNGANGQAVAYAATKKQAEADLKEIKNYHDDSYGFAPQIELIEVKKLSRQELVRLLNDETSPLRSS